jgi:hypothetical protein
LTDVIFNSFVYPENFLKYDMPASYRTTHNLNVKSVPYYMSAAVATKMQHFNELSNF